MPPKVKFNDGEHVLCFHGPLLYEAKCIRSEVKDKTTKYLVHYNGWNKSWDEWVPETRILKANEAGFQKQKELQQAHQKSKGNKPGGKAAGRGNKKNEKESEVQTPTDDKKKAEKEKTVEKEKEKDVKDVKPTESKDMSKETAKEIVKDNVPLSELVKKKRSRVSEAAPDTPTTSGSTPAGDQPKKKRVKTDTTVESEESFLTKIEVRVKIPEELKPWLVDDWDLVTRQKQLVQLPCKQTVDNILDDYIKSKVNKANNPQKDAIVEVTQGIREYFNAMLGTQLLYKFERPQYAEILSKHADKPMCQIYGASHLLRLFVQAFSTCTENGTGEIIAYERNLLISNVLINGVAFTFKLGGMLAYTPLDEKSLQILLTHIHDFLKFMSRSANTLFNASDYMVASAEHHRKAL